MESSKSFFASLFDFSFTTLITSKVIKFLYGLSMVGAGLGALGFIIGGFSHSVALGVVMLIIMVVFQMADHVAEIATQAVVARCSQRATASPTRCPPP